MYKQRHKYSNRAIVTTTTASTFTTTPPKPTFNPNSNYVTIKRHQKTLQTSLPAELTGARFNWLFS